MFLCVRRVGDAGAVLHEKQTRAGRLRDERLLNIRSFLQEHSAVSARVSPIVSFLPIHYFQLDPLHNSQVARSRMCISTLYLV